MYGSITSTLNLLWKMKLARNSYALYNCDFKVYMENKRGNYGFLFSVLPVALKTTKALVVLPSEFMWKNNSPVMIVSYCPKPNKKFLIVSTAHGEPDICDAPHKKPVIIDFYNNQRCCVCYKSTASLLFFPAYVW